MDKKHAALKKVMRQNDVSQTYLAEQIGINASTMSARINSSPDREWGIKEMYAIMDLLRIPHNKLHIMFPPEEEAGKLNCLGVTDSNQAEKIANLRNMLLEFLTG